MVLLFIYLKDNFANTTSKDFTYFAKIPIQHQGRIKPLDSFATAQLRLFSGRSNVKGMSSIEWLAETIFATKDSFQLPIFKISNPAITDILEITPNEDNLYSFYTLLSALRNKRQLIAELNEVKKEELTRTQQEILHLSAKSVLYFEISRSFSLFNNLFIVKNPEAAQFLRLEPNLAYNYLAIIKLSQKINERVQQINIKEQIKISDEEIELLAVADLMNNIAKDQNTDIMRVIPPQWKDDEDRWSSPWETISNGKGAPAVAALFDAWEDLARGYKDTEKWNTISAQLQNESIANGKVAAWRIELEFIYNKYKLFFISFLFYLVAAIISMLAFFSNRNSTEKSKTNKQLMKIALIVISAGLTMHIGGIIIRMLILMRPPVATFYESIIFVAAAIIIIGVILELGKKNGIGIIIACISGIILHSIGFSHLTEGDSLQMLTAVLNTNYWLATHVVIITLGYGACLVTSILAHIFLSLRILQTKRIIQKITPSLIESLQGNILILSLISLFLICAGTILGGIWADQSWGRFWGWDPKENGALLIILWLLLMLHGRLTSFINNDSFALGMVGLNIVVVLSWFGVNLLNIGLHTYGFIENVAIGMGVFIGVELLYISFCAIYIKFKVS